MALLDPSRVLQNIIALGVIGGVFFMVYSKMDKEQIRNTIEGLKRLFGRMGGEKNG